MDYKYRKLLKRTETVLNSTRAVEAPPDFMTIGRKILLICNRVTEALYIS